MAVLPRSTRHFGRMRAIWRFRYGTHAAISGGDGVRLLGGRHLQMFAMNTWSRV